jgi:polysaccharide biosynthesis transport protein
VMTAGPVADDPAKMLSSPRLKSIMAACHKAFDLVIVDAPAVVGLADAMLMTQHCSGLIMVVRLDQTDRTILNQALDKTRTLDTSLLGLVANGEKGHNLALRESTLGTLANEAQLEPQPKDDLLLPEATLHQ